MDRLGSEGGLKFLSAATFGFFAPMAYREALFWTFLRFMKGSDPPDAPPSRPDVPTRGLGESDDVVVQRSRGHVGVLIEEVTPLLKSRP